MGLITSGVTSQLRKKETICSMLLEPSQVTNLFVIFAYLTDRSQYNSVVKRIKAAKLWNVVLEHPRIPMPTNTLFISTPGTGRIRVHVNREISQEVFHWLISDVDITDAVMYDVDNDPVGTVDI